MKKYLDVLFSLLKIFLIILGTYFLIKVVIIDNNKIFGNNKVEEKEENKSEEQDENNEEQQDEEAEEQVEKPEEEKNKKESNNSNNNGSNKNNNKNSNNSNNNNNNNNNNNKPVNNTTKNEEQVIDDNDKGSLYYKSVTCKENDVEYGVYNATYFYVGSFPYYSKVGFTGNEQMSSSVIQLLINFFVYEDSDEEDYAAINQAMEELKGAIPSYRLNFTKADNGHEANYSWSTTDKNAFLRVFDDFGTDLVTYNTYLNYFKSNGITCNVS